MLQLLNRYRESGVWFTGLVLLFLVNPEEGRSFCLFHWLGIDLCPGCGLGHAVHEALHLHFGRSLDQHFLGIPAVFVLLYAAVKPFISHPPKQTIWTTNNY